MSYTFNKKLVEQVKAGTHCIEFNREKDSLEMLQALSNKIWPDYTALQGTYPYYYMGTLGAYRPSKQPDNRIPIPLSNFVQPEQSERDVMAELEERLKRLEDILLRDNEPCKAEQTKEEYAKERAIGFAEFIRKNEWLYISGIDLYEKEETYKKNDTAELYEHYLKSLLQTQD